MLITPISTRIIKSLSDPTAYTDWYRPICLIQWENDRTTIPSWSKEIDIDGDGSKWILGVLDNSNAISLETLRGKNNKFVILS